jgi:hypothetical protein
MQSHMMIITHFYTRSRVNGMCAMRMGGHLVELASECMVADAGAAVGVAADAHSLATVLTQFCNVMRCQLRQSPTQRMPCRAHQKLNLGSHSASQAP